MTIRTTGPIFGLMNRRTTDHSDQWTTFRTNDPSDYRTVGLLTIRTNARFSDQWPVGPTTIRNIEPSPPTQLIIDVQPPTVVELTAIWYYVMLMWCHFNDKWAVNFNVLMFFETIVYKNWESLNCPVSLWFEICALESVGRFDVLGGTVLSL